MLVSALGAVHGIAYLAHSAATKAYVASLGAALHVELASAGVHVTVLHPGPTRTPVMTELGLDPGKMPIPPLTPNDCVSEALRALARNRARCIPGRFNRVSAALVPPALTRSMMARVLSRPVYVGVRRPIVSAALMDKPICLIHRSHRRHRQGHCDRARPQGLRRRAGRA